MEKKSLLDAPANEDNEPVVTVLQSSFPSLLSGTIIHPLICHQGKHFSDNKKTGNQYCVSCDKSTDVNAIQMFLYDDHYTVIVCDNCNQCAIDDTQVECTTCGGMNVVRKVYFDDYPEVKKLMNEFSDVKKRDEKTSKN
jgi:hypothetical protein